MRRALLLLTLVLPSLAVAQLVPGSSGGGTVSSSILPSAAGLVDVGSSSRPFRYGFFANSGAYVPGVTVTATTSTSLAMAKFVNSTSNRSMTIGLGPATGDPIRNNAFFINVNDGVSGTKTIVSTSLDATEFMIGHPLDLNFKVGIRTINPAYNLDVNGTGRFTDAVTFGSTGAFSGAITVSGVSVPTISSSSTFSNKTLNTTNTILSESWHTVDSGGGEPAFANSWNNYNISIYAGAQYRKDISGRVFLRGVVKDGTVSTTTPAFTLPSGYRPTSTRLFVVSSNGSHGRVMVEADGDVIPSHGSNVYVSFDGIDFSTD